ncbi:transcriptional regulator, GntR family [Caldanaerobius fijiensis DSM 17918]|uniref:Transcriptional regulator, GntR family n=1 Tax=Caldanaerobius fijiensis DSM 17918 TaxID=1121256 RepID=A0A1M4Z5P2_9THEO|nr:GntR family transcriptional regulator [Caldanaerobius fijiensis]SHF13369.1 transcriptional regulator, GntR family [Caldanaerobius fijiensis DSM 17918]
MDNGMFQLENYKPLRELVFEHIKRAIITGELKPGERLMEVQLAEKLGVSRTPVREAIRKLELEGLVVMVPRKGAFVSDVSLKDIIDVFEVRETLEGLASYLAAERITKEEIDNLAEILKKTKENVEKGDSRGIIECDVKFHDAVFNASRNEKLIQIMANLQEHIHRFRIIYINMSERANKLVEEHGELLNAIKTGNAQQARKLAIKHVESIQREVIKELSQDK